MARMLSNEILTLKLSESRQATVPSRTRRDIRVPEIPGKALAVIGVRRGGKTSFMQRHLADRIAAGDPRDTHLLISLEDERLTGMTAEDLGWLLEEHLRVSPAVRSLGRRTIYLDEVQVVDGWATLVRRLLDEGGTEIFVSGSSARLLSREVSTSLRGRSMEVLMHPFSFRESLRHAQREPMLAWNDLDNVGRAELDAQLRRYLETGGFPEAQTAAKRDRVALLSGYVDVMVLRDVIDRHKVSNPDALRRLQRHLLSNPGALFSVSKFYADLKSQGIPVAKDTLHAYLGHLEDAFLIRLAGFHSASDRKRSVNPRKAYPIDTGLIPIFERGGREHRGRSLETVILLELERRGYTVTWIRSGKDLEVDFHAEQHGEKPLMIQVSLDTTDDATWAREVRALQAAVESYPEARAMLVTLDAAPPARQLPRHIEWRPASQWLLENDIGD